MITGIIAQQASPSASAPYSDADVASAWGVAGIQAIYSLRKTVPEYGGPVVQGKRVSDSALRDFYPTDDNWIDVAEVATWASGSDVTVEIWYDQSANGLDATAAYSNPPHLAVTGVVPHTGNNPAILFGTSAANTKTRLRIPFNMFASSHTAVMAGTRNSSSGTGEWGSFISALRGTTACITYAYADSGSSFRPGLQQNWSSDTKTGTSTINGNNKVFSWKRTGAFVPSAAHVVQPYMDGQLSTSLSLSFNSNALADSYMSLGGAANTATDRMNGRWSELVFHLSDLGDSDRESIENVMTDAMGYNKWKTLMGKGNRNELITITSSGIGLRTGAFQNWVNGDKGTNSTGSFGWSAGTGTGAEYLQFEFNDPCKIQGFRLYHDSTMSQGDWQFEGSEDGSSWTNLLSFTMTTSANIAVEYYFDNEDEYKFYRMRQMSGSLQGLGWNEEIEFYGEYPVGSDTTWFSSISRGDRTSLITATSSGITFSSGNVTKLIDGGTGNDTRWANGTGTGAEYLQFDFGGTPRRITGVYLQAGSASHGNWQVEGSDDASSWDVLCPSFRLSASIEYQFDNDTEYRYYRLRHMSGTRSNSPYLYEIQFRAAD